MNDAKKIRLLIEAAEDLIDECFHVGINVLRETNGERKISDEWMPLWLSIKAVRGAIARMSGKKKVKDR